MTTRPETDVEADVAAAHSAAGQYLADQVAAARSDPGAFRRHVRKAERRLRKYRAGGRLTYREAILVQMAVTTVVADIGRDFLSRYSDVSRAEFEAGGERTKADFMAAKAEFEAAGDRAKAVRRGLLADGYTLPTAPAPAQQG